MTIEQQSAETLERLLKRTFSLELHFALVAVKLNEIIEEALGDAGEKHANQLAHVMESFFETAAENNSRVAEALLRMREAEEDEDEESAHGEARH